MNSSSAPLAIERLLDAELVQAAERAAREHIECEAPALLVRIVRVRRVHDRRGEQADVVDLRLVAPALAVVDVERVEVEVERGRKRNQAVNVAVEHEVA